MLDAIVPILLAVGLVSGLLGGMLGIGGGVVIVPALIVVFELANRHLVPEITLIAVATSMACIVLTSAAAALTQIRAGKVLWPIFRKLVLPFVIGSFCAGLLVPLLEPWVVRGLIGLFLFFVGAVMVSDWKPNPGRQFPHMGTAGTIGIAGGLVSGTAGIAGGNVIVPTLTYFNVPIHNATATSSAMGVPIALFGALGYAFGNNQTSLDTMWMLGYIDLTAWIWIAVAAVIAAPLGVKIAHRMPAKTLKRSFGVLLLFVAVRMSYSSYQMAVSL